MAIPALLRGRLTVPVIGAPMFLVSFPDLVKALCKAGIVGSFPHLNARPAALLDDWLTDIREDLADYAAANPGARVAPFAVNLVVHRSNVRFEPDLETVVRHRVPLVFTSLGHPGEVVRRVHGYGGLVFCDVTTADHARKAAQSGVDGLICIGAGAGGHASQQSDFSLVREIRQFWDGCLILGGAINDGFQVRAAEVLGADLAYVGTRFLASAESGAAADYKQMIVDGGIADLVNSDRLSGIPCNWLRPSLERAGVDLDKLPPKRPDLSSLNDGGTRLWRDIWTAGHGIVTIHDTPPVADLAARLIADYVTACGLPASPALG
ncbi:NAD(P)H-dependent flavin oxidoreductase [Zavarzinia compransoris]|uniref:Nitronate monooxygenase n=1 Tax=Zavarzinia compransoris TaxID=1264899 RepID=A0A317E689_9PROT|nr:nitronate monooxygenase [Zavarzinia compransoris]PWR22161.1 nitronate monooxygenase [Zavarzinia compransoris]TDP47088.1 nitronate monooxygenase [Zavarzinia compransoris]